MRIHRSAPTSVTASDTTSAQTPLSSATVLWVLQGVQFIEGGGGPETRRSCRGYQTRCARCVRTAHMVHILGLLCGLFQLI